jgi:hypothetical protein
MKRHMQNLTVVVITAIYLMHSESKINTIVYEITCNMQKVHIPHGTS